MVELYGEFIGGSERAVPLGRQSGDSPLVPVHRGASLTNDSAQFLSDLGQGRRQLAGLPLGVRELPSP